MSLTMYQASVPPLLQILQSLLVVLDKAAAHCEARKIAPEVILQGRLYPDMFPMVRQVQIATDQAKGAVARLSGTPVPSYEDNETNFEMLKERLNKTITFVKSFSAAQIDGSEAREVILKIRGVETKFVGQEYLLNFVFPNFYFHATTAYAILRSNGVELGKMDFLGPRS